jgi:formamidopyrimidine-DNA glycosylase
VPELPEVETVRRGLAQHVVGRRIAELRVLRDRAVRRHPGGATDLVQRLPGEDVVGAVRRGKYLWLLLGGSESDEAPESDDALLLHLGMSGQLLVRPSGQGRPPHEQDRGVAGESGHQRGIDEAGIGEAAVSRQVLAHLRAVLRFTDGGELWFVDQRTFGHLLLAPLVRVPDGGPGGAGSDAALVPAPIVHVARDVLDPLLAPGTTGRAALVDRIRRRRTGLKRALLDQSLVSGIGNIYADEGLWRAAEHYERPTSSLSRARVGHVLDAVAAVMREALAAGGTSFDALYVNVNGASGSFDRSLSVYGRAGQQCRRCGAPVVREAFMNRSSFRCSSCQRPPRARSAEAGQRRAS